jgi:hypothetical protein
MTVTLDWDNAEKTILRLTLADGWEWEDLHVVLPVGFSLMQSVDHTVHILVDHTRTNHLAHGALSRAIDLMDKLPPNLGYVVVVTHILPLRRALKTIGFITGGRGQRLYSTATFDEAYRLMASYKSRE